MSTENNNKENILRLVSRFSAEDLFGYIQREIVTFEELQRTGRFEVGKQRAVRAMLKEDEEKHAEENEAWATAQQGGDSAAYRVYLQRFPNGRYREQAENAIERMAAVELERKEALIRDIAQNKLTMRREGIIELIETGRITREELLDYGLFSQMALDNLLNPPEFLKEPIYGWSDLPPLADDGRTDLYFFGIPSSGKSCMLAGLLAYAESEGRLSLEVDNAIGFKYAQSLINAVKIGHVPPTTPREGVNYIALDLYDDREQPHPLNIIEMSGEFFDTTYDTSSIRGEKSIGAGNYLQNNNRKLIFLIIDYQKSTDSLHDYIRTNQSGKLSMALKLLEKDKTLEKADGVFLILTKSDQLPNGVDDTEGANAFIDSHYRSLRLDLRRLQNKYNFQSKIFTFSLGTFFHRETFKYNPKTSEDLFEQILATTFRGKKAGGRRGLFS